MTATRRSGCQHVPRCPSWEAPDHAAARVVAAHPEQGWSLLCNGVVVFADTGEILPSQVSVPPHRPCAHLPMQAA
jgi:hypothetical protein